MATPSTPDRVRSTSERARRLVASGLTSGLTGWRRSLRTRVVVAVVLLCGIVGSTVGWLLLRQITDGLVESRVDASLSEAISETATLQEGLGSTGATDFDPETQLRQVVSALVSRGEVRGFDVFVVGPIGTDPEDAGVRASPGIHPDSLPDALRRAVASNDGTSWAFTRVDYLPSRERPDRPGVAVGTKLRLPSDGSTYGVYYLFPMDDEQRALHLVTRSLLTTGALLLILVAGVIVLVTRQVVDPIRQARRVAERIASGRLDERMQVKGEDDIARLATSFNQMADALEAQIGQLVDLSRVQQQFVSDVSHELRTPLTTVRMAGDVLHDARERFDPVTSRAAELLQNELDRFENLLADLLEISRFDAGAASLELHEVNVVDLVHRVVDDAQPFAENRGVLVVVEAPDACVAEVDQRRIVRVLRNLVTNAIDHSEPSGRASVRVRVAGDVDSVAVTVRDYGVGLDPTQANKVFHRFWRADPARARQSGGTGLGLAIALEDAQLHGGWLQVWGAPDAGAQFRLTIPREAGERLQHSPLPLVPDDARAGDARRAARGSR